MRWNCHHEGLEGHKEKSWRPSMFLRDLHGGEGTMTEEENLPPGLGVKPSFLINFTIQTAPCGGVPRLAHFGEYL